MLRNNIGQKGAVKSNMSEYNDSYPNGHLLVDVDWVERNAAREDIVLLDARREGYAQGHIPGSISFDQGRLKDDTARAVVAAETARDLLESAGIGDDTTVIVLDDGRGPAAARLFYVMEYYGLKDKVKLLNGGYAAWEEAGKPSTNVVPEPARGRLTNVRAQESLIATKRHIQSGIRDSLLLDVRSAEEYSGENKRHNRHGGHIRGSVNLEWTEALERDPASGVTFFKSYGELLRPFQRLNVASDKPIVPYCQLNSRGAHTYFVLRLLGFTDIRPYEGSWEEWGNAEDTEIV
ncbi:sulfurtransferase [Paenibacillus hodogayensis]|uniref:thiosulfate sulfurtransferase n=1 Tax=Paenibacillus hodogayensis TaxID=279208 RepID=A0ABV5VVQ9_9BACL